MLISILDRDCRYIFNNKAYEDWFGRSRAEIVGRRMPEVLGEGAFARLKPHIDEVLGGKPVVFESMVPYRTGGARHIEARYVPRRAADGAVDGFLALVSDITDRKRQEQELSLAFDAAGMASWDYDFEAQAYTSPGRLNRLFGFPEDHPLTAEDIWSRVHPDDAGPLKARQQAELADRTKRTFDREFRILPADGRPRAVYARGEYFRNAEGRALRSVGVLLDVTSRREAELSLQESESRFRDMAENAPVIVWITDAQDQITFMAKSWALFTGQPVEDAMGRGWLERVHPEDRPRVDKASMDATEHEAVFQAEYRLLRPDGSWRWVVDAATPRFDQEGNFVGHIGSVLDIEERKRAEDRLKGQSERLALLAKVASGLIADQDPLTRLAPMFAEAGALIGSGTFFHYMVDEAAPNRLRLASSAGLTQEQQAAFASIGFGEYLCGRVAQTRRPAVLSHRDLAADEAAAGVLGVGQRAYAGFPLLANNTLIGTIAFCSATRDEFDAEDVELVSTLAHHIAAAVDRARMEKRLRDNEERLRLILNSAREYAIITLNADGKVTTWNEGAERLLGYSETEVLGLDGQIFFTAEDRAAQLPQRERRQALAEGKSLNERWHLRKDGSRFWGSGGILPLQGPAGGFLKILRDQTEERRARDAEQAAHREASRLAAEHEAVLGQLREGVIVTDAAGAITFINGAAAALHGVGDRGIKPEEYSEHFHLYTEDGDPYPFEELPLTRAVRRGDVVVDERWRIQRSDGTEILAIGSATPVKSSDGELIGSVLTVRDDTERTAAEQALRDSNLRKELAIAAGGMGIWDWDLQSGELIWDEALCLLYGVDPTSFAPSLEEFGRYVHPDDREWLQEMVRQASQQGSSLDTEFRILRGDGALRWIGVRAATVRDERGKPVRMIGVNFDITESKKADERRVLLINELNHRVKNTLATVQSLAAQSFRGAEEARPLSRNFEARLMALSKAHNVLTRESWEGASLKEIANEALSPFQEESGQRILVEGAALHLTPKAALAFAMALHELATNAAKYGALSTPEGEVHLSWMDEGYTDRLTVVWVERGGPPVTPPSRRGFGSRLVERSLGAELGGNVRVDYRETGLVCLIETPLSAVASVAPQPQKPERQPRPEPAPQVQLTKVPVIVGGRMTPVSAEDHPLVGPQRQDLPDSPAAPVAARGEQNPH